MRSRWDNGHLTPTRPDPRFLRSPVRVSRRVVSAVIVFAELTVQIAGIVARSIERALARLLGQFLTLTVLLGLIVLLAIFDESPPATDRPARAIFLERVFARGFSATGLELLDVPSVSLGAMPTFGLRWPAVRGLSRRTFSHDFLASLVEWLRRTCGNRVPDDAEVGR